MTSDVVTLADLEGNPHPVLARLRASEGPVVWVPALGAWLIIGYDTALAVLRDSRTFTVDDPRFSTARVVGPSMLSLDGTRHAHHRGPFGPPFRADTVHARLEAFTRAEADRLVSEIEPRGEAELRRAVAGPLAVAVIAEALGLTGRADAATILSWYDDIVAATTAQAGTSAQAATMPESAGFAQLAAQLHEAINDPLATSLLADVTGQAAGDGGQPADGAGQAADAAGRLTEAEVISNAAVLMFGAIETTEGMIANAMLHLLENPGELQLVKDDPASIPAAVEESLRLEPAAAVVDRYATADVTLGRANIRRGDQVTVSISGANRDPALFEDPDTFQVRRSNAARHLAFAHGPHFCLGVHLARMEAQIAVMIMLEKLDDLQISQTPAVRGLVFRKPAELRVRWNGLG